MKDNGNSNYGKLFYAVILLDRECNFGPVGLDNKMVYSINYKDVGALVSDYPRVSSIKLLRKNLAPYHQVVKKASEHFTTIPAKFGQIARDAGEVDIALRKNYQTIQKELARLAGKVEVGLKITWNVEDIFEYFISKDEKLKSLRDQLMNGNKTQSQSELINFGHYFHERMNQTRKQQMGNRLIFLCRPAYVLRVHLTLLGRLSGVVAPSKHRSPWRAVMARSG